MFNCNANGAGGDAAQPLVPGNSLKRHWRRPCFPPEIPSLLLKGKEEGHRRAMFLWAIDRGRKYDQTDRWHRVLVLKASTAADVCSVREGEGSL